MMRGAVVFFGVAAVTLAACASRPARTADADCALTAADSVHAAGLPLYLECAVDEPATVVAAPIDYRPAPPTGRAQAGVTCYTAEVEFVVGTDGRPEPGTIRLLRSNDSALGLALLQAVPGWTYEPARQDGTPVRQLVRERRGVALAVTVSSSRERRALPRRPPPCR